MEAHPVHTVRGGADVEDEQEIVFQRGHQSRPTRGEDMSDIELEPIPDVKEVDSEPREYGNSKPGSLRGSARRGRQPDEKGSMADRKQRNQKNTVRSVCLTVLCGTLAMLFVYARPSGLRSSEAESVSESFCEGSEAEGQCPVGRGFFRTPKGPSSDCDNRLPSSCCMWRSSTCCSPEACADIVDFQSGIAEACKADATSSSCCGVLQELRCSLCSATAGNFTEGYPWRGVRITRLRPVLCTNFCQRLHEACTSARIRWPELTGDSSAAGSNWNESASAVSAFRKCWVMSSVLTLAGYSAATYGQLPSLTEKINSEHVAGTFADTFGLRVDSLSCHRLAVPSSQADTGSIQVVVLAKLCTLQDLPRAVQDPQISWSNVSSQADVQTSQLLSKDTNSSKQLQQAAIALRTKVCSHQWDAELLRVSQPSLPSLITIAAATCDVQYLDHVKFTSLSHLANDRKMISAKNGSWLNTTHHWRYGVASEKYPTYSPDFCQDLIHTSVHEGENSPACFSAAPTIHSVRLSVIFTILSTLLLLVSL